jgi:cysteine-rich repeat protein
MIRKETQTSGTEEEEMKRTRIAAIAALVCSFALLMSVGCVFNGSGIPLDFELNCSDGFDNDGDGLTDCEDSDCVDDPVCDNCGNGVLDAGEECDGGDNCTNCLCLSPWTESNGNLGCRNPDLCGNGVKDPGEECDGGNDCTDCTCPSDMEPDDLMGCRIRCGNLIIDPGEVCDDGNNVSGDGCSADCLSDESCGNGIVDSVEICDDGGESANCDDDCSLPACGDGNVNSTVGEQCDDSGESASCDDDCTTVSCGDGVVNSTAGEVCDDGGESASCDSDCSLVSCGDGVVNTTAGEQCDDSGESASCDDDCTTVSCGDGVVNSTAGEVCDGGTGCIFAICLCPEGMGSDGVGGCQPSASTCSDGLDNDGDGLIDCEDSDCFGPSCVEICDDGLDNDGDGDIDCDDSECGVLNISASGGVLYVQKGGGAPLYSDNDPTPWSYTITINSSDVYAQVWVYSGEVDANNAHGFYSWEDQPGYPTFPASSGIWGVLHSRNYGIPKWTNYHLGCP